MHTRRKKYNRQRRGCLHMVIHRMQEVQARHIIHPVNNTTENIFFISLIPILVKGSHLLKLPSGIFLSVLSEVGKLPIQGRHCDFLEMGLNMAGAAAGTNPGYFL